MWEDKFHTIMIIKIYAKRLVLVNIRTIFHFWRFKANFSFPVTEPTPYLWQVPIPILIFDMFGPIMVKIMKVLSPYGFP